MIVLDANILLYAYDTTSAHHTAARSWIEHILSGGEAIGIPWQTASAFLRVVTNPRLPGERFTIEQAVRVVEQWLEQPNVKPLSPAENYWPLFRQMIVDGQTRGPLITDAQLAALTIECGGTLHTTDRDFTRFPGLRWTNPLA